RPGCGGRPVRRGAGRGAGGRPPAGCAREHPLPRRRPLPRVGVLPVGRAHVRHLRRVQEDLHGRMDRAGRHRRGRGPACRAPPCGGRGAGDARPMSLVAAPEPRLKPLPPVAARIDAELVKIDCELDWLLALSPIKNDELWAGFEASGHTSIPELEYIDLEVDLHAERERLLALPMEDIESPLLSGLLSEKQRELERQLELVRMRGTDGFINASLDLFGGVEPGLLNLANGIMRDVQPSAPLKAEAGIDEVMAAVEEE